MQSALCVINLSRKIAFIMGELVATLAEHFSEETLSERSCLTARLRVTARSLMLTGSNALRVDMPHVSGLE